MLESLDDAAMITDWAWTGRSLMPRRILNFIAINDASHDWFIQFKGQPRASEEPAEYAVEIWTTDGTTYKRTLDVFPTQGVAAMFYDMGIGYAYSDYYGATKPPIGNTTTYANKNNLIAPSSSGTFAYIKSIQAIETSGIRIDVKADVPRDGTDVELADTTFSSVFGLIGADVTGTPPSNSDIPFQVQWFTPTSPGDPSDKYIQVYNYATKVYELVTNGMGSAANVRAGETFTILLIGNECKIYRNYTDDAKPLAVMNLDPSIFPMRIYAGASGGADMLNFMIRGLTAPTIYSSRQQIADFGSNQTQIRIKAYQKSKYPGIKGIITDYTTP